MRHPPRPLLGDVDQLLDFTTKDDAAAYVAAAAINDDAPRILRVAGDSVSVRDIAKALSAVTGERYKPLWAGSIGVLSVAIAVTKRIMPQAEAAFPPWQGMQYMRDQFSGRGRLAPVDNDRYPDLHFTSVRELLSRQFGKKRNK